MKKLVFLACLVAAFNAFSESSDAQNVIKDYLVDHSAYFAPDDYVKRGYVYRTQAGWTGFFNKCDDEEMKRHSEFIYWKQRHGTIKRLSYLNPVPHIAIDVHERVARLASGAGGCLPVLQHIRCSTCPSPHACKNVCKKKGLFGLFGCGCGSSKSHACDECDSCDGCDDCDSVGMSDGYIEMAPAPFEDVEEYQHEMKSIPTPDSEVGPMLEEIPEADAVPMPTLTTPRTSSRSLRPLLKPSVRRAVGIGVR